VAEAASFRFVRRKRDPTLAASATIPDLNSPVSTGVDIMLPLNDRSWLQLQYAGGSASALPGVLRRLEESVETGTVDDELMVELSETCHQWSTYDATYAVVPHLVRICAAARPDNVRRIELLSWIGWCVACLRLNRTEAPAALIGWFEESVPRARDLIAESLPYVDVRESGRELRTLRSLLAAFATCHGNPALGFVLSELEAGGTKCAQCGAFFEPMKSSLNPLWDSTNDGVRK
jgi:hypothetical protein